ncbi:trypsin 3A1-like [Topomyia yanbarensis]|uniref:trypsin 3A1-like n=1 Tax=Topomyia yanbarensis TaxID=2498891 RepID=UPI00273C62E6|nr:trypsin 3A1-like [Topomyia yanbarensis]
MEIRACLLVLCIVAFNGSVCSGGRAVPYKAVIEYKGIAFCGGSVIETVWILTTAKCVMNKTVSYITVRLGYNSNNESGSLYSVKSAHIHPKHNPETSKRALALLKLGVPVKYSSTINSIPLVKPGYGMEEGTRCSIPSSIVNVTDIKAKLWTREKCQTAYPSTLNLTDDALCAKITTNNSYSIQCSDHQHQHQHQHQQRFMLGSPLVCEGKQVAIVSRLGAESLPMPGQCSDDLGPTVPHGGYGLPDFFTDVAFGDKWISSLVVRRKRKPTGSKRRSTGRSFRLPYHRNGARGSSHSMIGVMLVISVIGFCSVCCL